MTIKNFAWIATWKITRRCNLYCVYCDHASMRKATDKEPIDYDAVIKNIKTYSPKILNISGGEPTLVPELPGILSEVKQQWGPFIRIVHNGTNPEKIAPCLPYMDRLVISLDGPDPVNKDNRGVSAQGVFKKLKDVLPEIFRHNVAVYFNCVLTTANLGYMRQFAQQTRELSPAITVSFTPVMPPDAEISILRDQKLFNDFLATYYDLKNQGFRVMHVFDNIMHHADFKHIKCFNQYFAIRVTPEGQVLTCAMNTAMNAQHYFYYFKKLFSDQGIIKALNRIKKKAKQNLFSSVDFSCTTMCACESWLDLVFLGIKSEGILSYAKGLSGRMTEDDYKSAELFVQQYINHEFNGLMLKNVVDAAGREKI